MKTCPLIKHDAKKTYGGMEVLPHIFLTLALGGNEWSASRPDRFTLREKSPHYPLDRGPSEPQGQPGHCGEEKKKT